MSAQLLSTRRYNWYTRLVGWKYSRYYWVLVLLVSAVIATAVDLWLTRNGPGASGDAVHYMQGAENLLAGHGFSRLKANGQYIPITGFPPGFSVALATLGLTGLPVFDAGRFLNAALFGLNIALVGWLLYRATRSGPIAVLGAWLFMYARNILQIHSWVMAEPLFLFLALLSILLLDLYLQRGKLLLLLAASLGMAYAGLTRYVGLALVPSAILVLLWFKPKKAIEKWRDAIIVGALSLAPVGLWFLHNALSSGNLVNRQLIYHPISKGLIFSLFDELSYWWFALSLSWPWKVRWSLLLLFFLVGVSIYLYRNYKDGHSPSRAQSTPIPALAGLFLVFYIFVLLLNTSFIDASTDVASIKRYAIPLVAIGIVWTFSSYGQLGGQGWAKTISRIVLCSVGLGMVIFYASKSVPFVLHPGFNFGYTDDRRNWTCEVDRLKAIDPQQVVITNNYEEYYFLAGRPAYTLTGKYDPYLNKYVDDYSESIESVQSMLQKGAILAILAKPDDYPPEANALIGELGLKAISDCSSLRLYTVPRVP